MIRLHTEDAELLLLPDCGGSIAAWRWRGRDMFRPGDGGSDPLNLASFPLIPFSNRIAGGRFRVGDRRVTLPPNFEQAGQPQTIHGFGWQAPWRVMAAAADHAHLRHDHPGGDWPWRYRADQHFTFAADAWALTLSLTNLGDSAMPAGLGIHPFFPRHGARLNLAVTGQWETDADILPTRWSAIRQPPDWFGGGPLDRGFTGRTGPIRIHWPTHQITMAPDAALAHTLVYTPVDADFFCVEPVSHMTNAVNRAESPAATGLRMLAPGEQMQCRIAFAAAAPAGS